MIDVLLSRISKYLLLSDEGKQSFNKYDALRTHESWKVHQALLVLIMNEISTYMLSKGFTQLEQSEKDVQQRAFYVVKEVIDFMLNPLKNAERYVALKDAANKKGQSLRKAKAREPGTRKGE